MKLLRLILAGLALASAATAQTLYKNVQKTTDGTNGLTEDLTLPAARTLTLSGTVAGTPAGGTLSLANLTLTLPTTVSGGTGSFQPVDADLTSWAAITRAAGFDTFVATPSSANLRALITDESGTGVAYFQGGDLGTPSAGVLTNATGLPIVAGTTGTLTAARGGTGLTALSANVVSLLGAADYAAMRTQLSLVPGTDVQAYDADLASWAAITRASGFDTFVATPSSANLAAALTDETGTGAAVFAASPTFTGTPIAPTAAEGTNTTQIATTAFVRTAVDTATQALDLKGSVRVISTSNITLSGAQTIDGVSIIAGDRVLVAGQTTASQNGIYVAAAGAWTRATDADTSADVTSGMFAFVSEGTANGSNGYVLTTPEPIVLGTTGLTFTQFSGAGQIIAGTGLAKSGNTLSISGSYVGQGSITTVGALTAGSIGGSFGAINIGSNALTAGAASFTTLSASGTVTLSTNNQYIGFTATSGTGARIFNGADDNLIFRAGPTGHKWTNNADSVVLMTLANGGGLSVTGTIVGSSTIQTSAGVAWGLGAANVVSPTSPNRTLTVTVGGTTYYIAAKTTND